MIGPSMREYEFYKYSDGPNEYGQQTLIKDENGEPVVQGTVKLAINNTSTSIQDNIRYKDATYLGLTMDNSITDRYVIQYGAERLKVLYVNPQGRYKQVFLNSI